MLMQTIQKNSLLAALPPHEMALLAFGLKEAEFQSGVTLQEAGEPIDRIYFPHNGLVSLQVVTGDGGSVETGIVSREGAVGLPRGHGRELAFTRAVVHVGGRFSVIPGEKFERACEESAILREILLRESERLCMQAQQIAACNASHGTEARLARWLLQRTDLIGEDGIPATQEFLAQIFCVRRTTITLIAHEMQAAGLIKYRRGLVRILDREGLRERSCECYEAVRPRVPYIAEAPASISG
jgi:CRP-like cAMP-binding protein